MADRISEHRPVGTSHSLASQRSSRSAFGARFIVGAGLLASLAFPSALRADEKPVDKNRPTLVAKTEASSVATVPAVPAQVQTVSYSELLRLDRLTQPFRSLDVVKPASEGQQEYFSTSVKVPIIGQNTNLVALIFFGTNNGQYTQELNIRVKAPPNYKGEVTKNGDIIFTVSLKGLATEYKKATGNDLKYVKLIPQSEADPELGEAITINVVPVEKPGGEIKPNTPMFGFSYFISHPLTPGAAPELVASAK